MLWSAFPNPCKKKPKCAAVRGYMSVPQRNRHAIGNCGSTFVPANIHTLWCVFPPVHEEFCHHQGTQCRYPAALGSAKWHRTHHLEKQNACSASISNYAWMRHRSRNWGELHSTITGHLCVQVSPNTRFLQWSFVSIGRNCPQLPFFWCRWALDLSFHSIEGAAWWNASSRCWLCCARLHFDACQNGVLCAGTLKTHWPNLDRDTTWSGWCVSS